MNYEQIGNKVKILYGQVRSREYRESDELEINSENHKHICNILKDISRSFGRKISVLDLGCGTGRYFHCLENVESLTGIDISPHMLEEARSPVTKQEIKVDHIELICANIFEVGIAAQSFDFIYSLGVLGEHSPFDLYICNRLFDWLKPGGKLFFTVVDVSSKPRSFKGRVAAGIYPLLPPNWKRKLHERWKSFYMTATELEEVMQNSMFVWYEISKHVSTSPLWTGAHWECIAIKDMGTSPSKR